MKKILALAVVGIVFGVIMFGSGVAGVVDPELIKLAKERGIVSVGMESNVSFLAPMPIHCSVTPIYVPMCNDDIITTTPIRCSD